MYIVRLTRHTYQKYPNLAPLGTTIVLFGLSDVLAQWGERRHKREKFMSKADNCADIDSEKTKLNKNCTTKSNSKLTCNLITNTSYSEPQSLKHDPLRTIAVASCAPFFNGGPLLWFHRGLDHFIGPEPYLFTRAVPKMIAIQMIYMPLSVPLFIFLSKFFHLSLVESKLGCMISGVDSSDDTNGQKTSIKQSESESESTTDATTTTTKSESSTKQTEKLSHQTPFQSALQTTKSTFLEAYLTSFCFWPLSDLLNFTIIQRKFGPSFRSSWDAVIDLGWNCYMSLVSFKNEDDVEDEDEFGKILPWIGRQIGYDLSQKKLVKLQFCNT